MLTDTLPKIPRPVRHVVVMLLVILSWLIFKFTDLSLLGTALKGLFGLNGNGFTGVNVALAFKNNVYFLIFCVIAVTPLGKYLRLMLKNLSKGSVPLYWINAAWEVVHPILFVILSAMALAGDSYNPFLYFQF